MERQRLYSILCNQSRYTLSHQPHLMILRSLEWMLQGRSSRCRTYVYEVQVGRDNYKSTTVTDEVALMYILVMLQLMQALSIRLLRSQTPHTMHEIIYE